MDLKLVPNRTRGVAPLSIFFDTVGTTSSATTRPFHELSYCWDFGDATSGTFATTGRSRDRAWGPLAGHVFEKPGTYTVVVSARDASGRTASQTTVVTVEDPERVFAGAATICLSARGAFEGCPPGATHVTGASLGELSRHVAPRKRLLLHRGETFDGRLELNAAGPGHIGAYGAGSVRPVVKSAGMVLTISASEHPAFDDWRVADLDFQGAEENSEIAYVKGKARNLLLLRVQGRNLGASLRANESAINYWNVKGTPGHDLIDGLTIQDADVRDISGTKTGGNLLMVAARRLLLLGNHYENSTRGEHVWRMSYLDRAVISENDLGNAPTPRHLLKLHGPGFGVEGVGKGRYTERVVLSGNVFRGTGGHGWSVALGPTNDQTDERLRDLLVERNLFLPGPGVQVALMLWGSNMTVQNNLFNRGTFGGCIGGGRRGIEPPSDRIAVLHNTCYSSTERPTIGFDPSSTKVTVFNNLCAGPRASNGCGAGGATKQGGNLAVTDAVFHDARLMNAEDFSLGRSSPAVDTGTADHTTTWDFAGRARPIDGDDSGTAEPDVGAMEFTAR
jgi:PKD repeat protein